MSSCPPPLKLTQQLCLKVHCWENYHSKAQCTMVQQHWQLYQITVVFESRKSKIRLQWHFLLLSIYNDCWWLDKTQWWCRLINSTVDIGWPSVLGIIPDFPGNLWNGGCSTNQMSIPTHCPQCCRGHNHLVEMRPLELFQHNHLRLNRGVGNFPAMCSPCADHSPSTCCPRDISWHQPSTEQLNNIEWQASENIKTQCKSPKKQFSKLPCPQLY